jgi:hypothetical protein
VRAPLLFIGEFKAAGSFICARRRLPTRGMIRSRSQSSENRSRPARERVGVCLGFSRAGLSGVRSLVAEAPAGQGFFCGQQVIGPVGITFSSPVTTSISGFSAEAVTGWDHAGTMSMAVVLMIRASFLTRARVNNLCI